MGVLLGIFTTFRRAHSGSSPETVGVPKHSLNNPNRHESADMYFTQSEVPFQLVYTSGVKTAEEVQKTKACGWDYCPHMALVENSLSEYTEIEIEILQRPNQK